KALRRLVAGAPPEADMRLQLVELAEGAVDIEGEQLAAGNAIGQQCDDELPPGVRLRRHGPWPRILLDVPEVSPGPRCLVAELAAVEGHQGRASAEQHTAVPAGPHGEVVTAGELLAELVDGTGTRGMLRSLGIHLAFDEDVPGDTVGRDHGL